MEALTLNLIANILTLTGAVIILLCAINFLKSRNIFNSIHFVILANIYGISILLIGTILKNYQLQNLLKIIILIILNLIITVILNQTFIKNAARYKKNLKDLKICKTNF